MKKFLNEFKEFAMRGNVVDMAVGVIIGSAFSSIVSSLVDDVIMPIITMLTGKTTFDDLSFVLRQGAEGESVVLHYGQFIQNIIDFIIIAFVIFCMVKAINKLTSMTKKEEEPKPEEPKGPTSEELLVEIRDILKEK